MNYLQTATFSLALILQRVSWAVWFFRVDTYFIAFVFQSLLRQCVDDLGSLLGALVETDPNNLEVNTGLHWNSGHEVIKIILCSTQLSTKFSLLINVKMPTFVGILTFVNRKNSILGSSEPEKCWIFLLFSYLWAFKISCSPELSKKKGFITLGPGFYSSRERNF